MSLTSKPNIDFPLNKGESNVQERKKKEWIIESVLRRLKNECFYGTDEQKFNCTIEALLSSKSRFSLLLLKSLDTYLAIFNNEDSKAKDLPLWIKLMIHGNGSRGFGKEISRNTDKLFNLFGISTLSELTKNLNDFKLLYQLGQYKTLSSFTEYTHSSYPLRSKIWLDKITTKELHECLSKHAIPDFEKKLIQSQYWFNLNSSLSICEIEKCFSEKKNFTNDKELLAEIQIINRANYFYHKTNKSLEIEKSFEKVDLLSAQIADQEVSAHIKGNIFGHKAKIAKSQKKLSNAKNYLQKAKELDYGFFEYDYLLAELKYKNEPQVALYLYEEALKTSPVFYDLIFDYGRQLWDMGLTSEANHLESLIITLGMEIE